jgi:GNAT superfamily N-acetyltransferase
MGSVHTIDIHPLAPTNITEIVEAFAIIGWTDRTVARYQRYLDAQTAGDRAMFVAAADGVFAGHASVLWRSKYVPFSDAGIPEISDLNVLPHMQRHHIATALMDEAEALIGTRGDIAGLGVGLYSDYGAAQHMYFKRGYQPDGRGVAYDFVTVDPGDTVRVDDDLNLMMTRHLR